MIDNVLVITIIIVHTWNMIDRPVYMKSIVRQMGTPLVKVLTGIRRCGKSSLLAMLEGRLVADGVPRNRILSVNMESLQFDEYRDFKSMHSFVREKLPAGGYFLLDEAQHVDGWERLAASLLAEGTGWVMPSPSFVGGLSFYEDFPYAWWNGHSGPEALSSQGVELPATFVMEARYADISDQLERKVAGLRMYASQVQRLFDDDQGMLDAVTGFAARVAEAGRVGSGAAERYWAVLRA